MKSKRLLLWLLLLLASFANASDEAFTRQREEIMYEELANKSTPVELKNKIARFAIQNGNLALASSALAQGANACYIAEIAGRGSSLMDCAIKKCQDKERLQALAGQYQCSASCIKTMYDRDINIDVPDKGGRTPLHHAAHQIDTLKVEQLVACKADVLTKDDQGRTPADCAMLRPTMEDLLVATLVALQKGTSVNLLNYQQYPFYQEYRNMILDDVKGDNYRFPSERRADYKRQCSYVRLIEYLKAAEQKHFK